DGSHLVPGKGGAEGGVSCRGRTRRTDSRPHFRFLRGRCSVLSRCAPGVPHRGTALAIAGRERGAGAARSRVLDSRPSPRPKGGPATIPRAVSWVISVGGTARRPPGPGRGRRGRPRPGVRGSPPARPGRGTGPSRCPDAGGKHGKHQRAPWTL